MEFNMKGIGAALILIGIICVIAALNMDVSVSTGYGRVNNIGLIASRQNYITIGGFISLCGILMLIFGKNKNEEMTGGVKCPFCAEVIKPDAIKCKHCGSEINRINDVPENDAPEAPE